MTRVGSTIFIHAPLDKVFRRVAQHDRCDDWLEFVSRASYTSEQSIGVGTSAHHSGQIKGRKMDWDGEIIEWVDNERIVWQASSGKPQRMQMKASNWTKKEADGTRYGLDVEYLLPYSILGKLMDVVKVRRAVAESIQKSLQRLKTVVELEQRA